MIFTDLTWNADSLGSDGVTNMGWQSQYNVDNGYLIVVDTNIAGIEDPLVSATETGQLYKCTVWSWDRDETTTEAYSTEEDCTSTRVEAIMAEVEALQGETFTEVTTTTTYPPHKTWD